MNFKNMKIPVENNLDEIVGGVGKVGLQSRTKNL